MSEPEESGPSEFNFLLLQLIRAYKDQKLRSLAYRALLIAREPSISDAHIQSALNAVPSLVPNKFKKQRTHYLTEKQPLQIVRDFLGPQS